PALTSIMAIKAAATLFERTIGPLATFAPALGPQKKPEGTSGPPLRPCRRVPLQIHHTRRSSCSPPPPTLRSNISHRNQESTMLKRNLAALVLAAVLLGGGAIAWAQTGDGSSSAPTTTAPKAQGA